MEIRAYGDGRDFVVLDPDQQVEVVNAVGRVTDKARACTVADGELVLVNDEVATVRRV